MNGATLITHKGKKIVYVDLSGCKVANLRPLIEQAQKLIASQPKDSALILTDVTKMELTPESSRIMQEFSTHNTPYTKASAVIGIEGLKKVIYSAVKRVTGRTIPTFDTVEQAKDWLVS